MKIFFGIIASILLVLFYFFYYRNDQISDKIAEMLKNSAINSDIEIIYQSVKNLHLAIPNHLGVWYFTGDYPTPGGNRVVNDAFINFYEGKNKRAY